MSTILKCDQCERDRGVQHCSYCGQDLCYWHYWVKEHHERHKTRMYVHKVQP